MHYGFDFIATRIIEGLDPFLYWQRAYDRGWRSADLSGYC
jgi:hypothetical protein